MIHFIPRHELRWCIAAYREEREELEQPDCIQPGEIPPALSLSGWMRNEREEFEFLFGHPREETKP